MAHFNYKFYVDDDCVYHNTANVNSDSDLQDFRCDVIVILVHLSRKNARLQPDYCL